MKSRNHSQAITDLAYLEKLGCDHDCVEIDAAVFDLMRDPTKKRAVFMYNSAMEAWVSRYRTEFDHDPGVVEIKERWFL